MRLKAITGIVLTVLLGSMLLAGISVLPVSATYYYKEFGDGDWISGSRDSTYLADADFDWRNGILWVKAWVAGPSGTQWAKASVYTNFMFIHDTPAVCTFEILYHIRGSMLWLGSGGCRFRLRASIWCMNQPSYFVNASFEHEDLGLLNPAWSPDDWKTRTMEMNLIPGYSYQFELHARAECEGFQSISGSYVYFMGTGLHGSRRIDLAYLKVYHGTYDATIEAYCHREISDPGVDINMTGSPTGFTTPHTFTGLVEPAWFSVPSTDSQGHSFKEWSPSETYLPSTTMVNNNGTYTAYYGEPHPGGGIRIPVNKPSLLAPYIGLASTIVVATAATAIYVKRVKRRKEKQ